MTKLRLVTCTGTTSAMVLLFPEGPEEKVTVSLSGPETADAGNGANALRWAILDLDSNRTGTTSVRVVPDPPES